MKVKIAFGKAGMPPPKKTERPGGWYKGTFQRAAGMVIDAYSLG
jgi:hypothetical protein